MTTYNTGNPLGSSDPRDLYDNAENLDNFVNGAQPAYPDRLGQARKSWAGMEQDFDDFLASSGFQFIGDYAAGIEVTEYNQVIREAGEFWRVSAGTDLPYTTTGAGMPEGGAFVAVGEAVLRQDLADPAQGASLIASPSPDTTYPEGTLARTVNELAKKISDSTAGIYRVQDFWEASDGDDHGPAIRKAYGAAGSAGSGIVLFPQGTIYVRSLGENPNFVIPIDSSLEGVSEFQRGNIHTIGFGPGNSSVILDVDATDRAFFGFVRRLNYCQFSNITINANDNATHAFHAATEYCPYLITDFVRLRGGTEYAAEIATYVSEFRNTQFTNSRQGLRLRGIGSGPVTSVSMTSCYANNNTEVGFHFGYLTYCTLNACAADHNELAYSFDTAYGVAMNGCGVESGRRAIYVGNYRGFSINTFFSLNMGEEGNTPDYLIELNRGFGATVCGVYDREGFATVSYALGSTSGDYGSESITVLDNSIRRDQIYQVPSFRKDRPITLLIGDRTQKDETFQIETGVQLQELFEQLSDGYEVNHALTINLSDGVYGIDNIPGVGARLRNTRGGGRIDIVGNTSSPDSVTLYSNANLRFENISCYVRLLGVTVTGRTPDASTSRIAVIQSNNVFINNCRILRGGQNVASAVRAERGSVVTMGDNNTIEGPWGVGAYSSDSSSRIIE